MNAPILNNPAQNASWNSIPHRVGVMLVICVFPIIWLGATVTTYAAGMAVPDWPGTYGYNMFLYPASTWLFGPFNLLVEHGHRLLASIAGLITIALVVVTFQREPRRAVKWYALALLAVILFQGLLGGARVLLDARTLARVHGMVGPAFFAMVVGFCVVASRWWNEKACSRKTSLSPGTTTKLAHLATTSSSFTTFALMMLVLSYLQLCVGSFLRHVSLDSSPAGFRHLVLMHLGLAVVVLSGTWIHWVRSRQNGFSGSGVRGSINGLLILVGVQFCLGLATWVVKYGWPVWFVEWEVAANFVIAQKSMLQANIITGHVAVGSLIVALWTVHFLRCHLAIGRSRWIPEEIMRRLEEPLSIATPAKLVNK